MLNGAAPSFDLEGGASLAAVRAVWLATLFCGFGALLFRTCLARRALAVLPQACGERLARRLRILARCGVGASLVTGPVWLLLVARDMADAEGVWDSVAAARPVLDATLFGHILAAQLVALAAAAVLLWNTDRVGFRWSAMLLSGLAVLLQAGHGHAAAMLGDPELLPADAVHLLAAAGWLGCLPPLALIAWTAPPRAAALAARDFTPFGRWCVAGVALSAVVQGWVLIGDGPGLAGTAFGWTALVKLALLGALLGFAAVNRYRLAPALLRDWPERARGRLLVSLLLQTGFGVAVVAAASVLSGLPPAIHVQPVWPFDLRPSFAAIREDAEFRREVIAAAIALSGAVCLLVLATRLRRRWRLLLLAAAAVISWISIPHLDLLLAEASPASYFRSPTGFSSASIMRGAALYPPHCASCHGADGRGVGPAASSLAGAPADLTASYLWMHSDGELFWWLSHGIEAPEGGSLVMPGFGETLSDDDRWALIDYIRARNAGLVRAETGEWSPPLPAPGFAARCGGPSTLAALRGEVVRLVIGDGSARMFTDPRSAGPFCATGDESVGPAYAVAAGIAPDRIVGAQFLIDGNGWLRALQAPGASPGWDDPRVLAAEIARLGTSPPPTDAAHHHAGS